MSLRIPLAKPEITDADREAVMAVLRTPHLSMGPKVGEFEQAICDYSGSKFAVAVNSGTSALHIAVRALGLEPGDEVILASFTFSALLNVILQEGLQSRFVDIDAATYNTTPELVAAAITERTRLIIAVHTFGFLWMRKRCDRLRIGTAHISSKMRAKRWERTFASEEPGHSGRPDFTRFIRISKSRPGKAACWLRLRSD